MNPATAPPQKFLLLLRYSLCMGVNEMRVKYYRYCVENNRLFSVKNSQKIANSVTYFL